MKRRVASEPRGRCVPRSPTGVANARDFWVIILAGGEGRRIRSFTTLDNGVAVPKQFCRFRDKHTLLGATLDRSLRITTPERIVAVVLDAHREWWEPELARIPAANILSQPANRGTAVAILGALVEIRAREPHPRIVVMPSDHAVEDEPVLLRSILLAQQASTLFPNQLVLLAIEPSHVDHEYGLIVPAAGRLGASRGVRAFVEKPTLEVASELTRSGALWNSFIFACWSDALVARFEETLPDLVEAYLKGLATACGDPGVLCSTGRDLPEHDFGRDVLQRSTARLRMIPVPPCGWTDLGTPARLVSWLHGHPDAAYWRQPGLPRLIGGGLAGAVSPAPG